MSYKNGALYTKVVGFDYGYLKQPDTYLVVANETVSDMTTYIAIRNGEIVWKYVEDDCAYDKNSLIDALYALKHSDKKTQIIIENDLSREDVDKLFNHEIVPNKFKEK